MVEEVSPDWLEERLGGGAEIQVIDTRMAAEYAAGHIPGAENVPYSDLADRIADIDWGETIVFVCQEGRSSRQAARILESYEGVDDDALVGNLAGGYDEWEYDLESA